MKEFFSLSKFKSKPANSYLDDDSSPPAQPNCGSPGSFPLFLRSSSNLSSNSSALSPSTSDYSSSLTFSPYSSNWSDLSCLSSRQPSPSSLSSTEPCPVESMSILEDPFLFHQEAPPLCTLSDASFIFGEANAFLAFRELTFPSAESEANDALELVLPLANESSHVLKNLNKSWSFSLKDSDEDLMEILDTKSENGGSGEVLSLDVDMACASQVAADAENDNHKIDSSTSAVDDISM